ncbi:MAG TPA: TlpA disulfide reductase family protein [Steroidobacteraceae bacterium]|nr:TlpA disulfide reductase family protein [Steroidobacteraceae bacterium]HNS26584.1 TlpA disulfide reductase family protein [Steroidobacteraceae bacterium]
MTRTTLFIAASVVLAACARPPADAPPVEDSVLAGQYRATLQLPGGELPFGFELVRLGDRNLIYLQNGAERLAVEDVTLAGDTLEARMPGYENRISAKAEGAALRGELLLVKRGGANQVIPFIAERGVTHRFFATPAASAGSVSGRWAVTFAEADGKTSPGVAEFRQEGAAVTGTILTPTGDHRYLAGEMRGNELYLSTFDGAHAYLYRAQLAADDTLAGTFWSGLAWEQAFSARRDEAATLEGAPATAVRNAAERLEFTFPDLDGQPVSLSDPRFADKVVVITLAGSWCPNCHDEAMFLAPWYQRNRARGLEVISLMFEHFGDFEAAAAATRLFRADLGIQYTTLIAGVSDRDDVAKKLPQLDAIYAFPTTLFLDRSGRVRHVHTGFSGPATGAHYDALTAQFDALLEQLLAEG